VRRSAGTVGRPHLRGALVCGVNPADWASVASLTTALGTLYGDSEGGERMITRFGLQPTGDESWLISVNRHWNIDRPDPR